MADVIKQAELKEFFQKKAEMEVLEEKLGAMRQSFIDRSGLGAAVEPGPFVLKVETVTQNRLDHKVLIENIAKQYGEAVAARFKGDATKASHQTRVTVLLKDDQKIGTS